MRNKNIEVKRHNAFNAVKGHRAYVTQHEVILEFLPEQFESFLAVIGSISAEDKNDGIIRITGRWGRHTPRFGFPVNIETTRNLSKSKTSNGNLIRLSSKD